MRNSTLMLLLLSPVWLPVRCSAQDEAREFIARPFDPRGEFPEPLQLPVRRGAEFAEREPALFSWMLFMYLNQPASPGQRGVLPLAAQDRAIGQPGGTLWETWKDTTEIYLPDGQKPSDWQDAKHPLLPESANLLRLATNLPRADSTWFHYLPEQRLIDARMIDGQQIVSVSNGKPELIRYNVKVNEAYFNYVVNNPAGHTLYNLNGQEAARVAENFAFDFPTDTLEVKAAWRILGPSDDPSRYWTAHARFLDEGQWRNARVGLTALHIMSKILPQWFWITFEQVDNPTETYEYFLQEKGSPVGKNLTRNPGADRANRLFQEALAHTKWKHYELIGWQSDATDAQGKPTVLANTQIETYFQLSSSCMTCHNLANIGPDEYRRLSMWQRGRDGIRAYVGDVAFGPIAAAAQPGLKFKQMDYVWSLRQAQKKP